MSTNTVKKLPMSDYRIYLAAFDDDRYASALCDEVYIKAAEYVMEKLYDPKEAGNGVFAKRLNEQIKSMRAQKRTSLIDLFRNNKSNKQETKVEDIKVEGEVIEEVIEQKPVVKETDEQKTEEIETIDTDKEKSYFQDFVERTGTENELDLVINGIQFKDEIIEKFNSFLNDVPEESKDKSSEVEEQEISTNVVSVTTDGVIDVTEESIKDITPVEIADDKNGTIIDTISNKVVEFKKNRVSKKVINKYIHKELINVLVRNVKPENKDLLHKCKKDIQQVLDKFMKSKLVGGILDILITSANKFDQLTDSMPKEEANKLIDIINTSVKDENKKLDKKTEQFLNELVESLKDEKDDITSVLNTIFIKICKYGVIDNALLRLTEAAGKYYKIDNPVVGKNMTGDQVLMFLNEVVDEFLFAESDNQELVDSLKKLESYIDKFDKELEKQIKTIKIEANNNTNNVTEQQQESKEIEEYNTASSFLVPPEQKQQNKKPGLVFPEGFGPKVLENNYDPNKIKPVHDVTIIPQDQLSDDMKKSVTNILESLSGVIGNEYSYTADVQSNGTLRLQCVHTNGKSYVYVIDTGSIIAHGGMYLIAYGMYIPLKETRILSKLFKYPESFNFNEKDVEICKAYLFDNIELYSYIDFVGVEKQIAGLSDSEYKQLGNTLDTILNTARKKLDRKLRNRFRFESFESIDKFTLVSDDKVLDIPSSGFKKTKQFTKVAYNGSLEKPLFVQYGNKKLAYKI